MANQNGFFAMTNKPDVAKAEATADRIPAFIQELRKTSAAGARHDVAVQRARSAQKEYDSLTKSYSAFPAIAEQKSHRRALAEREAAEAESTLRKLELSLSNTLQDILKAKRPDLVQQPVHQVSRADYERLSAELNATKRRAEEGERKLDAFQQQLERHGALLNKHNEDTTTAVHQHDLEVVRDEIAKIDRNATDIEELRATIHSLKLDFEHGKGSTIRYNEEAGANLQNLTVKVEQSATAAHTVYQYKISSLESDLARLERKTFDDETLRKIIDGKIIDFDSERNILRKEVFEIKTNLERLAVHTDDEVMSVKASINSLRQQVFGESSSDDSDTQPMTDTLKDFSHSLQKIKEGTLATIQQDLQQLISRVKSIEEDTHSKFSQVKQIIEGAQSVTKNSFQDRDQALLKLQEKAVILQNAVGEFRQVPTAAMPAQARVEPISTTVIDRLDALSFATDTLEQRFNRIQTGELIPYMVHQMMTVYPDPPRLKKALDTVDRMVGTMTTQVRQMQADRDTKINAINMKVDSVRAIAEQVRNNIVYTTNQKVGDIDNRLTECQDRTQELESIVYNAASVGSGRELIQDLADFKRKVSERCEGLDDSIGVIQAEVENLARLQGSYPPVWSNMEAE